MLYLAYGMNTNIDQMASRCPGSVSVGRVDIPDHRLVFRGVAETVLNRIGCEYSMFRFGVLTIRRFK
jgi:hypothetical protein